MNTLKFIGAAVVALILGVLAFANGGDVTVAFWPDMTTYGLPASPTVEAPVFVIALVCAVFGFLGGAMREYLREGRVRSQARRAKSEAAKLKAKVEELTADDDDDIPALTAR